jgi:phytoene dehydrogenase-like protein
MGKLEHKHLQAIVVGGGLVGLACAKALTDQHFVVLLLEATKQLGGRFSSDARVPQLVRHIESHGGEIVTEIAVQRLHNDPVTGCCLVETEWGPIQAEFTVIAIRPQEQQIGSNLDAPGLVYLQENPTDANQSIAAGQALAQQLTAKHKLTA